MKKTVAKMPWLMMGMMLITSMLFTSCNLDEQMLSDRLTEASDEINDDLYEDIRLSVEEEEEVQALAEKQADCDGRLLRLAVKLQLSEEQIAQLEPIMAEHKTQIEAMHANKPEDPEQCQAFRESIADEIETIHEESRALIAEILTDEQMVLFDELMAEQREYREQRESQSQMHQQKGQRHGKGHGDGQKKKGGMSFKMPWK